LSKRFKEEKWDTGDAAQLNYFNPQTRKAMPGELSKAASFCDGVRCDMAMLILKRIQKQIWKETL